MEMKPVEGKYLGQPSPHPQRYAPEVLLAIPRKLNRDIYAIDEEALPFFGEDVWHAYEFGFLTEKGLPVTGLLKIIYPADTPYLVESKSLKLYLNSLNMERFGHTPAEGVALALDTVRQDLNRALSTTIEAHFFEGSHQDSPFDFSDYPIIEETTEIETLTFVHYNESPHLLEASILKNHTTETLKTGTHLLRSNCKITHQPDWGSVFIYLKGPQQPTSGSLLRYLVSIRNEDHFHEEICELIYKRLWDKFAPLELMVACLYTRRGGIDICPVRVSHKRLLPPTLTNVKVLSKKLLRQ